MSSDSLEIAYFVFEEVTDPCQCYMRGIISVALLRFVDQVRDTTAHFDCCAYLERLFSRIENCFLRRTLPLRFGFNAACEAGSGVALQTCEAWTFQGHGREA